jgi:hypothetical protein
VGVGVVVEAAPLEPAAVVAAAVARTAADRAVAGKPVVDIAAADKPVADRPVGVADRRADQVDDKEAADTAGTADIVVAADMADKAVAAQAFPPVWAAAGLRPAEDRVEAPVAALMGPLRRRRP